MDLKNTALKLNINRDLAEQFSEQLGVVLENGKFQIDNSFVKGKFSQKKFPNGVELYHMQFNLSVPFSMHSINPLDSDYLLLNINLSNAPMEKEVNNQVLSFQKFLPAGVLFYSPKTEVRSSSPIKEDLEIAIVSKIIFKRIF